VRIDAVPGVREDSVLLTTLIRIASVVVCVIPARYRQRWPLRRDEDLRGPAMLSGLLEFLSGAPGTLLPAPTVVGVVSALLYLEGAVRLLAALSSRQILPTLPLAIIAKIHDRNESKAFAARLGVLVPDKVERGDGRPWDLRVWSCRAKTHWNSYITIRFDGEFYQMFEESGSLGARKFVYLLRRSPETRLVVVVYDFDPNDVMAPELPPRRWTPGSSAR
jgi:hypothetical protein